MRIIPVLDLLGGVVVHGVAGDRARYRPIVSKLVNSAEPLEVARAFRRTFGFTELYLADLDAIQGAAPSRAIYDALHADGFHLWVDAGIATSAHARALRQAGVATIVAGLETVQGPSVLAELWHDLGPELLVLSLDLRDGQPLTPPGAWSSADPWIIARSAFDLGVRRFLVLDLKRVGTGQGTGTEHLCTRLAQLGGGVRVSAGGGVRGPEDLTLLETCGVESVLVASALHDGRLKPQDVARYSSSPFPLGRGAGGEGSKLQIEN